MCACGYTHEQHLEVAIKPHSFQGKEWDPKKHVHEMPTDAFGDIVFTGLSQKVGKVGAITLILHCAGPCDTLTDVLGGGVGRMGSHDTPKDGKGGWALLRQTRGL